MYVCGQPLDVEHAALFVDSSIPGVEKYVLGELPYNLLTLRVHSLCLGAQQTREELRWRCL